MCTERCKPPEEIFWFIYSVVFLFCVVLKVRRKTLPFRRENTKTKMNIVFSLEDVFFSF